MNAEEAQEIQNFAIESRRELLIWTVYEHPRDYPDEYIARPHRIEAGAEPAALSMHLAAPTLKELRALLPEGLTLIPRSLGDEPQIVESWV